MVMDEPGSYQVEYANLWLFDSYDKQELFLAKKFHDACINDDPKTAKKTMLSII